MMMMMGYREEYIFRTSNMPPLWYAPTCACLDRVNEITADRKYQIFV